MAGNGLGPSAPRLIRDLSGASKLDKVNGTVGQLQAAAINHQIVLDQMAHVLSVQRQQIEHLTHVLYRRTVWGRCRWLLWGEQLPMLTVLGVPPGDGPQDVVS